MNTFHLAIDLGATSGRAILATCNGHHIESKEISRFQYPMLPIAGHLFWNLPLIYEEIVKSMTLAAELLDESGRHLDSIGIDSWGCDVAFFHKDGSIAGLPYCYRDPHTQDAAKIYCDAFGKEKLYASTGIQFMDFNTIFQLHTLRRANAPVIDAANKILFIPDAIAYMLTGHAVTEFTVASTSQMLNLSTGDFDTDILDNLKLSRDKFGPMVRPGERIGILTAELQRVTGLGAVPVIAVAGHDTASAVAGIPTPDSDYAYLSCGTWALLGIESDSYNVSDEALKYNFTNEGGINGTTRFLKNICGMWIFERVRKELGLEHINVGDLAASCHDSDCETLINPDDSSFANPESMTEAIKRYCLSHSLTPPASSADYVRVIFRSLAARIAEVLDQLRSVSPKGIKRLHVIGGGSKNEHLMKMLSQATGLPVVAGPAECTALGNILVQIAAIDTSCTPARLRQITIESCNTKTYKP
ncbi:MAG: rhamnulokinase [Muribaculaceae bacterium]|nr:rhamnulokinase [Muribaculaceae bacterium]